MSFRIDSFVDLINKYPRWDALSSFLTSPEGGSLRIIEKTSLPFHSIIRYVKEKSDFTKPWVKDARSIVWNTLANRPLCFAPVKSESPSGSDSIETTPFTPDSVYISEFIDGSMINAFVLVKEMHLFQLVQILEQKYHSMISIRILHLHLKKCLMMLSLILEDINGFLICCFFQDSLQVLFYNTP